MTSFSPSGVTTSRGVEGGPRIHTPGPHLPFLNRVSVSWLIRDRTSITGFVVIHASRL